MKGDLEEAHERHTTEIQVTAFPFNQTYNHARNANPTPTWFPWIQRLRDSLRDVQSELEVREVRHAAAPDGALAGEASAELATELEAQ